jgi:hypothetical protein
MMDKLIICQHEFCEPIWSHKSENISSTPEPLEHIYSPQQRLYIISLVFSSLTLVPLNRRSVAGNPDGICQKMNLSTLGFNNQGISIIESK